MPRNLLFPSAAVLLALSGCASVTTSELIPSPQAPVCKSTATAAILWVAQWRPDQKDVHAREAAIAEGLTQFLKRPGCFQSTSLRRLADSSAATINDAVAESRTRNDSVVVITVRELGPTVKIGASLALVEGGTEVVLQFSEYVSARPAPRTFTVQWRSGGPGILKGIATLPQDMQAALTAGFQPPSP